MCNCISIVWLAHVPYAFKSQTLWLHLYYQINITKGHSLTLELDNLHSAVRAVPGMGTAELAQQAVSQAIRGCRSGARSSPCPVLIVSWDARPPCSLSLPCTRRGASPVCLCIPALKSFIKNICSADLLLLLHGSSCSYFLFPKYTVKRNILVCLNMIFLFL